MDLIEQYELSKFHALRTAIESTNDTLEGIGEGSPGFNLLVTHLGDLLRIEKSMFVNASVQVEPVEKPWYPDDSGGWIETFGNEPKFNSFTQIERLADHERATRKYYRCATDSETSRGEGWDGMVAYKVIKS